MTILKCTSMQNLKRKHKNKLCVFQWYIDAYNYKHKTRRLISNRATCILHILTEKEIFTFQKYVQIQQQVTDIYIIK